MLANPNNVNIAYRNMIGQYIIYSYSYFCLCFHLKYNTSFTLDLLCMSSLDQVLQRLSLTENDRWKCFHVNPRTRPSLLYAMHAHTHTSTHTKLDFEGSLITTEKLTDQWQIRGGYCANANRSSFAFRNLFILFYFYHRLYFFRVLTGSEPRQGIN